MEVLGEGVLVINKDLESYYGGYAGVTKIDRVSAMLMREELNEMVEYGFYAQWYENALVQLVLKMISSCFSKHN